MSATPAQPVPDRLLAEFPEPAYADWRKLVEAELKGAPFEKKMLTVTPEGITLQPLYQAKDIARLPHVNSLPGFAPYVRGTRASGYVTEPWAVAQEITEPSPEEFNLAALNSISRGLNALNIVVDEATRRGNDPDFAGPHEVAGVNAKVLAVRDKVFAFDAAFAADDNGPLAAALLAQQLDGAVDLILCDAGH